MRRSTSPGAASCPSVVEPAGGPERVVTIADFGGAQEHGVPFGRRDAGRAVHALAEIGELIEAGRFSLPVVRTFPLAEVAEAHRVGEGGRARGKLVLLLGSPIVRAQVMRADRTTRSPMRSSSPRPPSSSLIPK